MVGEAKIMRSIGQKLLPSAEESLVRKFMLEGMSAEEAYAKAQKLLPGENTAWKNPSTVDAEYMDMPVPHKAPAENQSTKAPLFNDTETSPFTGQSVPVKQPTLFEQGKSFIENNPGKAALLAAGVAGATASYPNLTSDAKAEQSTQKKPNNILPKESTKPTPPKASVPAAASVSPVTTAKPSEAKPAMEADTAQNTLENLPPLPDPMKATTTAVSNLGETADKIEQQKPGMGEVVKSGYEQMLSELKDTIAGLTAQQAEATDEHKKAMTAARIGEAVSIFAHALNKYAAASEGVSKKLNVAQYYDARPADFKPTYDAINMDFAEKMQGIRSGIEAVTKQQRDVMKQKAKADEIKAGQEFEMAKMGQQFANEKEMQGIKAAEAQRSEGFKSALETKITEMKIKADAEMQAARAKSDKERDAINNAAREKLAGLEHSYRAQEAQLNKAEKDDLKLAEMEEKNIAEQRASIATARNALNNPSLKGDARSNMIAEYATRLGVPVVRKSAIFGEGDIDDVATLTAADKAFDALPTMGSQLKARLDKTNVQAPVAQPAAAATPAPAAPNIDQGRAQTAAANALKSAPMGATVPITLNGVTYKFKKTGENSVIIVQ